MSDERMFEYRLQLDGQNRMIYGACELIRAAVNQLAEESTGERLDVITGIYAALDRLDDYIREQNRIIVDLLIECSEGAESKGEYKTDTPYRIGTDKGVIQ